jgi:hypothetical protein
MPGTRAPEPAPPEAPSALADAIRRARHLGDRGVAVVKQGPVVLSAEPSEDVPPGVVRFVAVGLCPLDSPDVTAAADTVVSRQPTGE